MDSLWLSISAPFSVSLRREWQITVSPVCIFFAIPHKTSHLVREFAQTHNLKISFHFLLLSEHLFCIIFIWWWSATMTADTCFNFSISHTLVLLFWYGIAFKIISCSEHMILSCFGILFLHIFFLSFQFLFLFFFKFILFFLKCFFGIRSRLTAWKTHTTTKHLRG